MAAIGIMGKKQNNPGSVLHRVGQCGPQGNQVSDLRHSTRH